MMLTCVHARASPARPDGWVVEALVAVTAPVLGPTLILPSPDLIG
jgi:hypothetical protein